MPNSPSKNNDDFDAIVIGTGFAGAVTACRLVQAGQKICVLERGRRYGPDDFPVFPTAPLPSDDEEKNRNSYDPPPDISRWFWSLGQGLWDVRDLEDIVVAQAAGYGGGSLIYANVHLRAPKDVFDSPYWPEEYNRKVLDPYYDLAAYMLDVKPIPKELQLAKTAQLHRAANKIGREGHWFTPPLAINFDQLKEGKNKFGRKQNPCDMRGECWKGCGAQAKNTLDLNYLAIVEDSGLADIRTLAEVTDLERGKDAIFCVKYHYHLYNTTENIIRAPYVFLCAGAVNTTELLLRNKKYLGLNIADLKIADKDKEEGDKEEGTLGRRFFPNADSFAMIFNCDEPQEADYGPTITSALLYNEMREDDSCSIVFQQGVLKPLIGSMIEGEESGASGVLATVPNLSSGSWEENDAEGMLMLTQVTGTFEKKEFLRIRGTEKRIGKTKESGSKLKDWFLVEEGGFPTDLEPLLGIFRSPLWLGRNRFLEPDPTSSNIGIVGNVSFSAQLPRRMMEGALTGLPSRAAPSAGILGRTFNQYQGILSGKLGSDVLLGLDIWEMLPEWLRIEVKTDFSRLQDSLAFAVEPLVREMLDEATAPIIKKIDLGMFGLETGEITEKDKTMIVRGLLRQSIQLTWGSEVDLAGHIARFILKKLPQNLNDLIDLLPPLLAWAFDYRVGDGRTAMLLTMGRDLSPGSLALEDSGNKRLIGSLPGPAIPNSWQAQELVLRDIASRGWKGELRTNPAWPFLGRRVTVHSQGGCSMGGPNGGVTKPCGEVVGCSGLYVMDGAAFPTSVGVNPSATIAAIAEYKIEKFILGLRNIFPDDETITNFKKAEEFDKAKIWAENLNKDKQVLDPIQVIESNNEDKKDLEPIRDIENETKKMSDFIFEPSSFSPLGLTFEETMIGYFSAKNKKTIDWSDLKSFPAPETIDHFEEAENYGVAANGKIKTSLVAKIGDLGHFLAEREHDHVGKISVVGKVKLENFSEELDMAGELDIAGELQMFLRTKDNEKIRYFRYTLFFEHKKESYTIHALKVVRDDPGFDVWKDTSTLYFDIFLENATEGPPHKRGILRIPAADFFQKQIGSFKIKGTNDPARKKWALAAFGKYFFGNLVQVYIPELARISKALENVIKRTHG